ncbi:MAG TPA: TRAP transporter substrate-binding protein DctP [Firmicutes bacterium]|nr:TRAP transporter substrate-binding protein DctP [Bacillota bacterium]
MQKKRLFLIGLCLALILVPVLTGCSGGNGDENGNDDKVYDISLQIQHPRPQFLVQEVQIPYAETLKERSEGRLDVTVFDIGAVVSQGEEMDGVVSGLLEIGIGTPNYAPGEFPLSELACLPMLFPSSSVASLALCRIYEEFPEFQAEYPDGAEMLSFFTGATYQLHTVNKPVRTLEDVKGLDLIAINKETADIISQLGANPITIGTGDWYISLERGMAEGIVCPFAPIRAMQVSEIARYHTVLDMGLSPFYVAMNKNFYDNLPEELRQIIDEESGTKFAEACGYGLDHGSEIDIEWMLEQGGEREFILLTPEEKADWAQQLRPIWEANIKEREEDGLPAQKIVDAMERFAEELVNDGVYVTDYEALIESLQK